MLGLSVLVLLARDRIAWPLQRHVIAYASTASALIAVQLFLLLIAALDDPGTPSPLTYVPVLNPFDLLTLAGVAAGAWCFLLWRNLAPARFADYEKGVVIGLGGLAFMLSTLAVVRGVYHYSDVAWNGFSLRRSVSVQAALSIYWALLGVTGMVLGNLRQHYWTWLVGVGLMFVVAVKLFIVDLGNSGTVARIVSFIVVGALFLVVGYFAPRPPRPWDELEERGVEVD